MSSAADLTPCAEATERAVRALGRTFADQVEAVAAAVSARVVDALPELGAASDARVVEETLDSGLANIGAMASMLAYGIPVGRIEAPHGAVEFARAMIRRGVELPAILRAYRVGHAALWELWLAHVTRELAHDGPLLAAVVQRSSAFMFGYIDTVCERMVDECDAERARWAQTAAAARAATARMLLDATPADVESAARTLHYDLHRHHLALIIWRDFTDEDPEGEPVLQRAAGALAAALGCADPLVVPAGRGLLWAWIGAAQPFTRTRLRELSQTLMAEPVHVAIGEPAAGVEGFRASHREAAKVVRVCQLEPRPVGTVVPYASVAFLATLCADPAQARSFAELELGSLAADEANAKLLCETLTAFIDTGCSHVRAARALGVHEKTVTYRVRRAEQLLGHPVAERRTELAAALLIRRSLA